MQNAYDGTIMNRVYILHPSFFQKLSPPPCFLPENPLSFLYPPFLFFSAATPSSCWGRSLPWTIRSASRWSCGWAQESPWCRRCASRLREEAEKITFSIQPLLINSSGEVTSQAWTRSYLSRSEGFESLNCDLVVWADPVVIWWVSEGQRQETLLLQVGFCREEGDALVDRGNERWKVKVYYTTPEHLISYPAAPWILAKLLTMMALPPRWRGSSAACSLLEPSP